REHRLPLRCSRRPWIADRTAAPPVGRQRGPPPESPRSAPPSVVQLSPPRGSRFKQGDQCGWSCGTVTGGVWLLVLFGKSVHCTVFVYTRPVPVPDRSALRLAARFAVITQSGAVLPSPRPLIASLLVTAAILHTGFGSQISDAVTETVMGTSLWLGGHSTFGL